MIWKGEITLDMINRLHAGTMGEALGIRFTAIGEDSLTATMPFGDSTKQPFGLLHGGASVALAETMGSVATWCAVNREQFIGVGIEINANHLKAVTSGVVTAVCKAIRCTGKVHVWEIRISDETGDLTCISRFTCMVVPRR
jgi:1,4-dihydroxy-2-naphthoyl-CoA hydrolase